MTIEGYLTTTQAGERLGIKRARVIALITSGRLPAKKIGNTWLIREKDLDLVKNRKPGRPRKQENTY